MKHAVFCYGSNSYEQITQRCGVEPTKYVPAILPNHRRIFQGHSRTWNGGVANVVPSKTESVKGAYAEICDSCLADLDRYEGIAGGYYIRVKEHVILNDGSRVPCWIYLINPARNAPETLPSAAYLRAIDKTLSVWKTADTLARYLSAATK
jgi:gamma-glutamylcyclotransferase (GGCT)/AIG2-like uncharacterized protein YtfP